MVKKEERKEVVEKAIIDKETLKVTKRKERISILTQEELINWGTAFLQQTAN